MNKTPIEWAKNPDGSPGYTWNPITGCLNGCEYCYARKLANTRLKERYLANKNIAPVYAEGGELYTKANNMIAIDPFFPRFWPDRLSEPVSKVEYKEYSRPVRHALKLAKGKGIFVCDMSDLFGIGVPEEWTRKVLNVIEHTSYNRYYLLTKQPQNLIKFSPFPDNCWVGVTATDNVMFHRARHRLEFIDAKVKFISFEPLLERIKIDWTVFLGGINWVIIGAQTKPYKPPKIEWVREIVEACDKAGVKVFLKDNLWSLFDGSHYAVPLWAFSSKSTLRQEIPSV